MNSSELLEENYKCLKEFSLRIYIQNGSISFKNLRSRARISIFFNMKMISIWKMSFPSFGTNQFMVFCWFSNAIYDIFVMNNSELLEENYKCLMEFTLRI